MPFTPADTCPVELLPDGRIRATGDIVWTGSFGDTVTVPAGYVSDGATRPWFTAAIVDEWGPATRAFLVHDVLCDALRAVRRMQRDGVGATPEQWAMARTFTPVDVDNVLRVVMAELGVGIVRWIYWTGVRYGAAGSAYRRPGWLAWKPLALLVAWTLPALIVMLPAVLGALISRALLWALQVITSPWEWRARKRQAAKPPQIASRSIRSAENHSGSAADAPCDCPHAPLACPIDGDRCTRGCDARPDCEDELRTRIVRAEAQYDPPTEPKSRESAPRTQDIEVRRADSWTPWITHAPWPALDDTPRRSWPRRAAHQLMRPIYAIGRGLAYLLCLLLEAL